MEAFPETHTLLICYHNNVLVFPVSSLLAVRLLVLTLTWLPWQPGLVKATHLVKLLYHLEETTV